MIHHGGRRSYLKLFSIILLTSLLLSSLSPNGTSAARAEAAATDTPPVEPSGTPTQETTTPTAATTATASDTAAADALAVATQPATAIDTAVPSLPAQTAVQPLPTEATPEVQPTELPPSSNALVAPSSGSGPEVILGTGPGLSAPLTSMHPLTPQQAPAGGEINPQNRSPLSQIQGAAGDGGSDLSILQSAPLGALMPAAAANFNGIGATGSYPPDTEGDIGRDPASGKKYYMQFVNTSYQIWDVTNPAAPASVVGPLLGTTLWSGLSSGNLCHNSNGGDPVVLFDHLANRWFASQLAYGATSDFHQCIAVSQSSDPTGSWYAYDFLWSNTVLNDYPKFAVWPDGYYLSVNQFDASGTTFLGAGVAVFDRAAMLAGTSATLIKFDVGTNYASTLPSDLDGPAPAVGTPNFFSEWDNTNNPTDTLRLWNFHVDWGTPANSTFGVGGSHTPNQSIAVSNQNPNVGAIRQPGTSQTLDTLADRLMHRLQYRNFGAYQTLVGNRTVRISSSTAGIYWFELRNSGATWSVNQQGVYSPDTGNRWMGSIAMDGSGDMGLGYSVSSSSTFPSVRYTGRLSTDTLGTLPQGEASLVAGGGSQTGTNRWGDYSMMGVDPTDDCTFWYTQEYYSANSAHNWKTRIGSFSFPTCVAASGGGDTVGVFRPSNGALYLKNSNTTGFADVVATYGLPGDYPVVGDWDGNGTTTIGVYRNAVFYLRNANTNGFADLTFGFGAVGDQPVAGDWNGDGVDTIGVYRSSTGTFFLRNSNSAGPPDITFTLGIPGDVGIAGDWNGDGMDTTGVFRPSNGALYLKNSNTTGFADIVATYGLPGDQPVTGDWDSNGTDTIGIYRNGGFYLRNSNTNGFADIFLALGISADMPIAGNWDGLP